jgi:2-methylcitrate dehydratase PrpD
MVNNKRSIRVTTRDLARHIASIKSSDLGSNVMNHAKACCLDWVGCALAGSLESAGKIAKELVMDMGGVNESTVIGTSIRTSSPNAALANGILGHCLELDDIHEESVIHPAASVMPAALAICEKEKLSGVDLLTSIICGYEAEIRIAKSIMPSHYRYWHTTGTCGTFGATAAVGKLLSLEIDQLVHAFGIAGTQAGGLVEVFGTMSKPLNAGKAAMNGVISGLLAEKGFTSSDRILEAEKGYCRATSQEFRPDTIFRNDEVFEITSSVFKRYSCCGHIHGALDAVLAILDAESLQLEDISEVRVGTYPIAIGIIGRSPRPSSASEARFSLPYCVALALVYHGVGPTEFAERFSDDAVFKLSTKVRVEVAPELSHARLGAAIVEVRLVNGRKIKRRIDHPKGHPQNPLSRRELEGKFRSLVSPVLKEADATRIIEMARDLEGLSRLDELFALLRLGK